MTQLLYLVLLLLCTACGTSAASRNITLLSNPDSDHNITPNFSIEIRDGRDNEGFCIRTYQQYFYEEGDHLSLNPLRIEVTFDNNIILHNEDFFIFWNNGTLEEFKNEQGELIGSFLSAPMHICFSTQALLLGEHTAEIQVKTTSGIIHSFTWQFSITEIELKAPSLQQLPLIIYLRNNPSPVPEFMFRVPDQATQYSRGGYSTQEGLCMGMRGIRGEETHLFINNIEITGEARFHSYNEVGELFLCADTITYAAGLHLARVSTYSGEYTWVFEIK